MKTFLRDKKVISAIILFVVLSLWWLYIAINHLQGTGRTHAEIFGASYGVMALFGGFVGLMVSKRWGGFRSLIGKSTGLIALGLLAQEFGQLTYSYLGTKTTDVPYPSIGDIGYFGSIILYIVGVFYLIKAVRVKSTLSKVSYRAIIVALPIILLTASYWIFLRGYQADPTNKLATILDFGYPLGQAFYFSLAILAYLLSRKYLGGLMKPVILLLIVALLTQYASDFTFLYRNNQGTWQTAGINDFMYLTSYFMMTISLLAFGRVIDGLRNKVPPKAHENLLANNDEAKLG